ncbi:jg17797 [Pararge aegeria aegeria]|uniref:oleoyl-[acyl-carrier-protein] hydrolase n=1 Tax=Pararge aegeria aegeria TaxID=348720 RepID=A0A8S4SEY1_9NEOP|nr:jg17797 [Pararge aegeria aegeria]
MAATTKNLSLGKEREPARNTLRDKVVISGISGLYAGCHSVKDLSNILYNKINPIKKESPRWKFDHPEVAQYTGPVPDISLFDAQFFKVHFRLANNMDPMARKLLEQAYQAIYDAGLCPEELSGKKIGVYIGSCFSESEKSGFYATRSRAGFGIPGCSKAMFANRISYWLNAKGPSMNIDDGCCSSTAALEQAYHAINRGECEAAIVGGSNLCLHPQSSIHYGRIVNLSIDGKTKSFDTEAAGCVQAEAINILFLQKAKDALRIYAEVVHVKCTFTSIPTQETKDFQYGFYRDPKDMAKFMHNFYDEIQIPPQAVEYVEAFGSAVPEADKAELEAIETIYCFNRKEPLFVGSVMSNIGYVGSASGISAITKVILGYHSGLLAGNLNCDSPRNDIAALRDGRLRILTEHHRNFGRAYTAINGLSMTGSNAHVLIYGHFKSKDLSRYKTNIPRLVFLSGRQESSVNKIIQDLKSRSVDPEEIALLHNIHKNRISGHVGRGFILLDTNAKNETICLHEKSNYFDDAKRPLWFVYSGMGSQWAGMGAHLMRIPIFAAAIEKCRLVLEPKGVDIVHIITSTDKTIFDNILNSFVGISAIQIGLTDVLRALEIVPDKIIGHSVGELGCAYADGCFTAEEMILAAYSRGLVSVQTPLIRGSMAAVGIGYEKISKMCPPEIEVACHNGPDSSTISGPADIMKEFVAQLTAKEIFAREVPCSNIAYHSRYIADAGPGLLKYLGEVIKSPKARSERWVSTSVPQDKWNEPIAKYSSAEYHTNNLLNSVLFAETSTLIPANAVVVEIAPHGLLQAILKRSLPESCKHVPLTRRGHPDNAQFLLEAIGNLYMEGYSPQVQELYPKVEFPVSSETPMLSHLLEWVHNESWTVPLYVTANRKTAASCTYVLSIHDDEHRYLRGHVIRETNSYPFAATLVAVWDTLAMVLGVPKKQLSVQFRDVHLHSQPNLHEQRQLRLNVTVHRGKGQFEVLDDNIKVASGFIDSEIDKDISPKEEINSEEVLTLKSKDIYSLLDARDYNYSDEFKSIYNANLSLTKAHLLWKNNWVTLIDGIIQLNALRRIHESVSQPDFIRRIIIDVEKHSKSNTIVVDDMNIISADVCEVMESTRCGGVLIENIKFYDMPSINKEQIALKALKFIPHVSTNNFDEKSALHLGRVLLHLEEDVSSTQHKINCSSDRLQLLLSENDVLGIQLADRLISRGARKLALHCSNKSNSVLLKQRTWEKQGVQCTVSIGNRWNENIFNLLNSKMPEVVEGIYCILNSNAENEQNIKCLEHLTLAIRRSNWPIKYFAVIDARNEVSEMIKLTKPHDQFATIQLPSLNNFKVGNKEYFSISHAIDAIEKALCYKERVIAAHRTHKPMGTLLQELASLADFSIPNDTSQEATLEDLGMDLSKSQIVRAYLRNFHCILLDESIIPKLTVKKILELEDKMSKKVLEDTDGLKTFFSHIDPDDLLATAEMVFLPTLTAGTALSDNEFDVSQTYLCVVPGVEGLHVRFHELCERLKIPALVLQPGVERPHETIQEMAQRYAKILLNKIQLKKRFYLLGYESGVLVALEMAAILEDHGLTGSIFCIGGAPDDILDTFEEKLAKFETDESLQVAVATHMYILMNNDDNPEDVENILKIIPTWKGKVTMCVQKLLGRIDHSIQYAKEFIEAAYVRILQVNDDSSSTAIHRIQGINGDRTPCTIELELSAWYKLRSCSGVKYRLFLLRMPTFLPAVLALIRCIDRN